MPGGGLFALVSFGGQNVLLNGNPEMTYWYKTFRRYTHFAEESYTIACDGPDQLLYDQDIQVRAKIKRVGDLVRDMYFVFRLPDIYSKYIDPAVRAAQYNFAWANYIGCRLIRNVALIVGGQKIQEFSGKYIATKALMDLDQDALAKWKTLVGETPELTNPALGIYGGGSESVGYPTVYRDDTAAVQVNRPSIFGQDIYVPLPFWCCENPSLALPLVALQYHEVEIQLTLRPIWDLYTILDSMGNRVRPGYYMNADQVTAYQTNNPTYNTIDSSDTLINNFLVDIGFTAPPLNTWDFQPRFMATYVWLTDEERKVFGSTPLNYLVYQVQIYKAPPFSNRQLFDLNAHNPATRLLIGAERSDTWYRNELVNFTNWWTKSPPYNATPNVPPWVNYIYATGRGVPQGQRNIINTLRVIGDGNELQEEKSAAYFEKITPWKYATGLPPPGLLLYPFSLHSPTVQPSGSINCSRIRLFELDVNPWPLPQDTNYVYDLTVFIETINWFTVSGGMGGLKYAL